MVYSLLLWGMAAILDACQDTLEHHYRNSIFCKKGDENNRFWNMEESNKNPIYVPKTKYKVDAWHLVKSIKIILLAMSLVFALFNKEIGWLGLELNLTVIIVSLIILGVVWNGLFNLFYNYILIKNNKL